MPTSAAPVRIRCLGTRSGGHRRARVLGAVMAATFVAAFAAPTQATPHEDGASRVEPQSEVAQVGLPEQPGSPPPAALAEAMNASAAADDATERAGADALAKAALRVELTPCEDDPSFLCGTVPVPIDRARPGAGTVNLHIEVFPHTGDDAEPEGTVLVTGGGPGWSVTQAGDKYGVAFYLLADLAQTRDIVFVDQRGLGLSDAIDCLDLQAGVDPYKSARDCHDQLGETADQYGTVDVVDDLEDVRQALGLGQVDLLGGSYAGLDMAAYAVRYPENVRSLVLGSPVVNDSLGDDFELFAETSVGVVESLCARSPQCDRANPDPERRLQRLADRLRHNPVTGTGVTSTGESRRIRVTERSLVGILDCCAEFIGSAEITPAAAALERGDRVPLLRLAADSEAGGAFDYALDPDPTVWSAGHELARVCVDAPVPWDKDAGPVRRLLQYGRWYADQPASYGPFSKEAWLGSIARAGFPPFNCIGSTWADLRPVPDDATVTGIPTLIVNGEYDTVVPTAESERALETFPEAELVTIANAGHVGYFFFCGPQLVQRFIADLDAGDTSCADDQSFDWWVPGSFPATLAEAPKARQTSGPSVPTSVKRLATVAAWTVLDGVKHSFVSFPEPTAGLRGGEMATQDNGDGTVLFTFRDSRFAGDTPVSGTVLWTDTLDGELTVIDPKGKPYAVTVSGVFNGGGQDMTVTVDVGGKVATFAVPSY